jgi:Fur family ferric uptake transcriptional regulator
MNEGESFAQSVWGMYMATELTDLRREIVSVIENAERHVSVKIILSRMISKPNISTVYRALDYLDARNYISSVSFSGIRFYYSSAQGGHGHFLFCKECHEILEFDECVVANLQKKIQKHFNYQITGHVIYFEGLCSDCTRYLYKKSQSIIK